MDRPVITTLVNLPSDSNFAAEILASRSLDIRQKPSGHSTLRIYMVSGNPCILLYCRNKATWLHITDDTGRESIDHIRIQAV